MLTVYDVMILLQPDGNEPAQRSFPQRGLAFDFGSMPVPVDAIAYTQEEWAHLETASPRFYATLTQESIWVWRGTGSKV